MSVYPYGVPVQDRGHPVQGLSPTPIQDPGPHPDIFKLVQFGSHCTAPLPDMFKLVILGPNCTTTPPPPDMFKLVHYVARAF